MKKILSAMLAVLLSLGCFACDTPDGGGGTVSYGTLADATLWGAPGYEKVLQDVHTGYDDFKTDAEIDLTVAKGEKEAQHVIITAKDKHLRYTVELSDLKASDGTVFPKEKIELFHEKYIEVKVNYSGTDAPTGWYPDALVPYENIVNVGENVVEPNSNQGLYFRFDIPLDQKAGVYTGTAKLTIGGQSTDIPVSLNVMDVAVSEVNHTKSIFLNEWSWHKGELDTTQEMLDKYTEALFEYRMSPNKIVVDSANTMEDIEFYVDLSYKFMQNPKCSNITIPYSTTAIDGQTCIDPVVFTNYLMTYAKKSFETGYNMFDKLVCYISIIDEPQMQGLLERVKVVSRVYRETLTKVADTIAADETITSPIKDAVVASIRKVRNVVTSCYVADYAPYVDTWCPQYQHYDGDLAAAVYADQEEKWWYGCIGPRPPYPTNHTEDTLLSARLVSWMQAEYGVVGNLNWATTVYARYDGQKYIEIEDYYTGSASRFPNVNGDGYYFYPGKMYGVDGPIGSLRLETIRDGLEEYELLYEMKNNYKATSDAISAISPDNAFSFDKMVESITMHVYSGTRVIADHSSFADARQSLFALAAINQATGVSIADFYDDSYGKNVYTLIAPSGVEIKQGGDTVTATETIGAYEKYVVGVELNQTKNSFAFTAVKNGTAYTFEQTLGGKATVITADQMSTDEFKKEGVTPTATIVDANTVDGTLTGKLVKIELPKTANNVAQSFNARGKILEGVGATAAKMVLHVYYEGEDEVNFIVSAKHAKQMTYYDLTSTKLKKGMNTIEITLAGKNWDKLGNISYIAMYLGAKKGEPARTVYIADSVIYQK